MADVAGGGRCHERLERQGFPGFSGLADVLAVWRKAMPVDRHAATRFRHGPNGVEVNTGAGCGRCSAIRQPAMGFRSTFMGLRVLTAFAVPVIELPIAEVPLHGSPGDAKALSGEYGLGRGERCGQCPV